jgi:glycosyltransferase involved in cell wall biosynthesis
VVFHAKHKRTVARLARRKPRLVLVAARADLHPVTVADFEVLQSGRWADGRRRFFLPYWPQAGLVGRDPARGVAVRRLGYKGFAANLHPGLRAPEWRSFVAREGFEWETDEVEFSGTGAVPGQLAWHDYSRLDVVIALRPPARGLYPEKPASKLVNAWRAGVPAILGPEYAYRELRRSALDYLEAASPAEVREAVVRLARDPTLYRAMVENGLRRAPEFSFEATTRRWASLLLETQPPLAGAERRRLVHRVPRPLRAAVRRLRWGLLPPFG